MPTWVDEQIARQRYDDIVQAEQRWLVIRDLVAAQPQPPRFYGPLLAGLGRRLVIWGFRLEERYSAMVEPSIVVCNSDTLSGG